MPIQTFNFANVEPIRYGNAFSDILAGFKMKEDAEDRRIKNEGDMYQNTIRGAQAANAPEMEQFKAMLQRKQAENYERESESQIGLRNAQAAHANAQTSDLNYQRSFPQGEEIPGSLNRLPKNEQTAITKDMTADLRKMQELIEVKKELKQFREINKKFPKMNESFMALLLNGGENPGAIAQAVKKMSLNKKEYEALTQGQKIANSIALRMARSGQTAGGRWTDFMARLVQSTKPSPLYPNPTNDMIIDNLDEELSYVEPYAQKLAKGLKERFAVYPDYQAYKKPKEEAMADALTKNSPSNIVKVKTSQGEFDVPREELDDFINEFPDAVERE